MLGFIARRSGSFLLAAHRTDTSTKVAPDPPPNYSKSKVVLVVAGGCLQIQQDAQQDRWSIRSLQEQ